MAASAQDLQVLLDKAGAHANKMNYQLSAKKSCCMVFGNSSLDDMDVNFIKLKTGHDKINTVSGAIVLVSSSSSLLWSLDDESRIITNSFKACIFLRWW